MMGFRRAACPHAAAKGGQGRSPLRKYRNACVGRGRTPPLRRSKRCGTERYPSPFRQGRGQFSDGAMGRVVRPYGWIWGRCNRADVGIGPYEGFPHKKSERPKMGRSGDFGFCFYFLALLSTTSRSRAVKSSRDMAPRSPSTRCRGETVPFSMSRSPTTTM